MMRPVLVMPPALQPVSLAQAKAQCRVDGGDEDQLLEDLIDAAVSHLDGWSGILGRCLVDQTWRVDLWGWDYPIPLPFPDVSSVSVTYRDSLGASQTVAPADVLLHSAGPVPEVGFASGWSAPPVETGRLAPISVTFTAGYGQPDDVPAALRRAILLHVEALYDRLEDGVWRPAYTALTEPRRVVGV